MRPLSGQPVNVRAAPVQGIPSAPIGGAPSQSANSQ